MNADFNANQSSEAKIAARKGHASVVEVLAQAGADKEAMDSRGKLPLYWAAQERHASVVEQG